MSGECREYRRASEHLISMIKNGELAAGERLPAERVLSEQLGISRNSVREAVRSLENMGIIESRHGSGNYITGDISSALSSMIGIMLILERFSADEICSFRRCMEKAVCAMLINSHKKISAEDILKEDYTSPQEETEADRRFHFRLTEASENRLLISIMSSVTDIYRNMIDSVLTAADSTAKQQLAEAHMRIIGGINSGDISECEKAIDMHYNIIDKILKGDAYI